MPKELFKIFETRLRKAIESGDELQFHRIIKEAAQIKKNFASKSCKHNIERNRIATMYYKGMISREQARNDFKRYIKDQFGITIAA